MIRKSRLTALLLGVGALCFALLVFFGQPAAQEKAAKEKAAPEFTYVGVAKCKGGHSTKKSGAQYKIWSSKKHSHAFETLKTAESDSIAKAKGIEGPAAEAPECLACHVTAYGEPAEAREASLTQEEGVSCESCHGPGSVYRKMKPMKQLYAGEIEPASVGLTVIDEKVCAGCHNEKSPTYKPIKYEEALAQIAHPVPPRDK